MLMFFQEAYPFQMDETLWFVNIALFFLAFVLFLLKTKKLEEKSQKNVYLGYSAFALLYGLTRLFFVLGDLCGNSFKDCQSFYPILGYLTGILGLIVIIFIMETYLLKTRKVLTSISIILFCLILSILLIIPAREGRLIALAMIYILIPVVIIAISISYLYFAIKSTGASRKKALETFIAIVLIFVGHLMSTTFFIALLPDWPLIIAPIIMLSGIILIISAQLLIK